MKRSLFTHGFVAKIGPQKAPQYFTGAGYSTHLNDAKVFASPGGCKRATQIWQRADYNDRPLPPAMFDTLRTEPVCLMPSAERFA